MEKGRRRKENTVRLREGRQEKVEGSGRKKKKTDRWRKNQGGKGIFACSVDTQSVNSNSHQSTVISSSDSVRLVRSSRSS